MRITIALNSPGRFKLSNLLIAMNLYGKATDPDHGRSDQIVHP